MLTDALTERGLLRQDTGFALTDAGVEWFGRAGVALDLSGRRRWRGRASTGPSGDRTSRRGGGGGVVPACAGGGMVRAGGVGARREGDSTGERALSDLLGIAGGDLH